MEPKTRSFSRFLLPGLLIVIMVLGSIAVWYSKRMEEPAFRKDGELTFGRRDSSGQVVMISRLDLEIAQGNRQTLQGLMFRSSMEENQGMLFVFAGEEPRSFWMRNTEISLDILFADRSGKIVTIRENTVPFSEAPIPSTKPAQFVVEVNAGYCQRHGIQEGDLISITDNREDP